MERRGTEVRVIVVPRDASGARRWLAHLLRASCGAIRAGDRFDDDLVFDADSVARIALRHRVAPLLHRALQDGRITDVLPVAFAETCERTYWATLRKNLLALAAGDEILAAFDADGISAAPLKGWVLLTAPRAGVGAPGPLYADPGTRPMDDLDLVVARSDRDRAGELLRGVGFAPVQSESARTGAYAGGHEIAFHRRDAGVDVFVELHWASAGRESLLRGMALEGDEILRTLCTRSGRVGAARPTRLGHLLFTAFHGARHAFDRWIWLHDLHLQVVAAPLDWEALVTGARALRARAALYAGLVATRELLRTPVPKEVLADLAPGVVRRELLHRTLSASMRDGAGKRPGRMAKLLLGESWWEVARTAAWATLPGAAWYAARGEDGTLRRRLRQPARALLDVGGRPS